MKKHKEISEITTYNLLISCILISTTESWSWLIKENKELEHLESFQKYHAKLHSALVQFRHNGLKKLDFLNLEAKHEYFSNALEKIMKAKTVEEKMELTCLMEAYSGKKVMVVEDGDDEVFYKSDMRAFAKTLTRSLSDEVLDTMIDNYANNRKK